MAKDVITRFKLETTQYDSKLKSAAKGLSDFSKTATQAGQGFQEFTKKNIEAASALGTTATSTTNAKDRVKELVSAYNEAAKAYNQLSEQQRQSDWAKALAGSLTQLQQRIREAKQEMQGMGDGAGSGLFSGLTGKLDGMLQVFGGNLMTKAASAVAGLASEMGEMVRQGIEMAKAGEGVRMAFERLNNPGILDSLREATHGTVNDIELMKAAVKFNDFRLPVEELGTMLAFAQQKAKDTGQSVDYMVDSIVTGLGRKSLMILDNLGLSASEIKERMKETGDMTKAVGAIIREQMEKAGDYVETAADRAAQATVSLQNKMEELGRKFAPLEEASNQLWTSMKIGILDVVAGPLARLLNGLTEAGRQMNAFNDMNAGSGGKTSLQNQLDMLREYSGNKQEQYQRQLARYTELENDQWREYNNQRNQKEAFRQEALKRGAREDDVYKYNEYDRKMEESRQRAVALQQMRAEYIKGAQSILNPSPTQSDNSGGSGTTTTKTRGTNQQEQAQKQVGAALQKYNDTIELAARELEAGTITDAEYKKRLLSGQQHLYDAYGTAYRTYADPKYKQAQDKAADEIVRLGGEVQKATEQQKKTDEVARALEQAQRKLAQAQDDAAKAWKENDLKAAYKARDAAAAVGGNIKIPVSFTMTGNNLDAFIADLKQQIAKADIGSEAYNTLSEQLSDATALSGLIQLALQNGVDMADLSGISQAIWQKLFGEEADVPDEVLQGLGDQIGEAIGKGVSVDGKTGKVDMKKEEDDAFKGFQKSIQSLSGAMSGLSTIGSGLQAMGIQLDSDLVGFINGIQGAISVVQGVISIINAFSVPSENANTVATNVNTSALIALQAAVQANSAVSLIPFAGGGIVHAATGIMVPGNNMSGDNVPALLNSGELILNKAQQGVLAADLQGGSMMQNLHMEGYIAGEDIRLVLSNSANRRNDSEYLNFEFS